MSETISWPIVFEMFPTLDLVTQIKKSTLLRNQWISGIAHKAL